MKVTWYDLVNSSSEEEQSQEETFNMCFMEHIDSEVSDLKSIIPMSYDELEEAFEELHESFQKLVSKYNALKKKHYYLSLSYDELELDNKKNIFKIDSSNERLDHMTIENRSLKERHLPLVLNRKSHVIN